MRWQGEMNILPNLWGQVNPLSSPQFKLHRKRVHLYVGLKILQAGNALETRSDLERARGKESAITDPHIERLVQWRNRKNSRLLQTQRRGTFLPLDIQGFSFRNLIQVNFHSGTIIA